MNYYEHHIGDYAQATAHLSFVEDAAYSRLLRKYYAEEKPLPADLKVVQRLVGARTKEEREAVEVVLGEFFSLEADGWHNKRCDQVIAEYQAGEPEREMKRVNAAERQRKARERRSAIFQELASHGIHPDWNASMSDLKRALDDVTKKNVTTQSQPVTCDVTATHTPIPNTQSPEVSASADRAAAKPSPSLRAADLVSLGVPEQIANDFLAVRKAKRAPLTRTALDGLTAEAEAAGVSLGDALATCALRGWQSFKADWLRSQKPLSGPQSGHTLADHNRAVMQEALRRAGQESHDA